MPIDNKIIKELFEGFDAKLVSEDLQEKVKGMIDDVVESRVAALSTEMEDKESFFLKEAKKLKSECAAKIKKIKESYDSKEKILEEEAKNFSAKVLKSLEEKEAIMVEEVNEFKAMAEQVVAEESKSFRDMTIEAVVEETTNYRNYIESIALEETMAYRKEQDAVLANDVSTFKESLVDQISEFMEAELTKSIPEEIMEAAVKVSAYEPLVESIVDVFGKNYIKVDNTSYEVIKEARKENEELAESLNEKSKDVVRLGAEVKKLEKDLKIYSLTEGMTAPQKAKTVKLLESCSVEDIDGEFNKVKDIIIEESVKAPKKTAKKKIVTESNKSVTKPSKKILSDVAKKKIEKLKNKEGLSESVDPEIAGYANSLNRQLRSGD
jgi:hypothetical protein